MRKFSEILNESYTIPYFIFQRIVNGKENIDTFRSQVHIGDDESYEVYNLCSKNTYIVDEKIIKRILDDDMVKSYDKHKDELFEYGLQDPDTIKKIDKDINHPEDTDIISDVTSEDKPMDGDIRKLEYDILSTYMNSVNMSYTDIVCAIFTNYKDKEDNVYYNVIIGYGDEKIYDIFKKIKLS